MNALKRLPLAAAVVTLLMTLGLARANMLAVSVVTGTVEQISTAAGQESVTVNGTTYSVQAGSQAVTALASVNVGDYVDLQVTPSGDPAVPGLVVGIAPHSSTPTQPSPH